MKLKVGAKMLAGFLIVLAFLLAVGVTSALFMRSIAKDVETINTIKKELGFQKGIDNNFNIAVSGLRGLIAYGTEKYKDEYKNAMSQVIEMEKSLLEISSPEKKATVQKLIELTTAYDESTPKELFPAIEKLRRASGEKEVEEAKNEIAAVAGKWQPVTYQIKEIVNGFISNNDKLYQEKFENINKNIVRSIYVSLIMTVTALFLGIGLSILITGSIKKPIHLMMEGAKRFAEGDFTTPIEVKSADELGSLAGSLNGMAEQLKAHINEIIANAQILASNSEELAASAEEVSATVEEVASTTGEVASMAEKSLENASRTAEESRNVVAVAESGGATVGKTIEKINSIAASAARMGESVQNLGELSARIGNITDVITGIADQTNLLALNAAIEAARAGEQGRGFAVVAEEVRKLAEQSADAAKEIGQLIGQIQSGVEAAVKAMEYGSAEVKDGVELASQAGAALRDIIGAVNKNIGLMEEIIQGARQASEGMQQLSASNEQVTSTIQQVAGATQQLAEIAGRLQASVNRFKI
ncbi:MAG: methyl-accepting chemotaxis protein [Pelotomaculum sp.]|uniref:Hypothetical membrane protein n=1 Tax=Pelotomaculum thermopropionicum (strain DSM 13744 / JCM 10971 / SI) TaxID=370438 RepID=A5D5V1_PELTS|nr:methyl-accepting chemotaxis protein [Pelotomaculum sp.]BAF58383.1 hypothetical membrane protein [Pelotomaculum thermopropionicum SI]